MPVGKGNINVPSLSVFAFPFNEPSFKEYNSATALVIGLLLLLSNTKPLKYVTGLEIIFLGSSNI